MYSVIFKEDTYLPMCKACFGKVNIFPIDNALGASFWELETTLLCACRLELSLCKMNYMHMRVHVHRAMVWLQPEEICRIVLLSPTLKHAEEVLLLVESELCICVWAQSDIACICCTSTLCIKSTSYIWIWYCLIWLVNGLSVFLWFYRELP